MLHWLLILYLADNIALQLIPNNGPYEIGLIMCCYDMIYDKEDTNGGAYDIRSFLKRV